MKHAAPCESDLWPAIVKLASHLCSCHMRFPHSAQTHLLSVALNTAARCWRQTLAIEDRATSDCAARLAVSLPCCGKLECCRNALTALSTFQKLVCACSVTPGGHAVHVSRQLAGCSNPSPLTLNDCCRAVQIKHMCWQLLELLHPLKGQVKAHDPCLQCLIVAYACTLYIQTYYIK